MTSELAPMTEGLACDGERGGGTTLLNKLVVSLGPTPDLSQRTKPLDVSEVKDAVEVAGKFLSTTTSKRRH